MLEWYDPILRRVSHVSRLSGQPGEVTPVSGPAAPAGLFLVRGEVVVFDVPAAARLGDTVSATFRVEPPLSGRKSLATVRQPSSFIVGSPVPVAPPLFAPSTIAEVGWDGDVVHSLAEHYDLQIFPSIGSPWRLTIALSPNPVLPAMLDSAIAEELKSSGVRSVADLPASDRERIKRARRSLPAIEAVRVLRDGTIWIRPTPARAQAMARWDVFSRTGSRVGYAELPSTATITDGTARWIIAAVQNDDDVSKVIRYEVTR